MSIGIIGSQSGTKADVDTDRNQREVWRTPGAVLGSYSVVAATGAITATLGANSGLFAGWWNDVKTVAVIESVDVSAYVTGTITTAVNFDLKLIMARDSATPYTGGTSLATAGANSTGLVKQTRRTAMPQSSFGDLRIAGTTALSAGSINNTDLITNQAIGYASGNSGTVVGTQFFAPAVRFLYRCKLSNGAYPIVMELNDKIIMLCGAGGGPATGTFTVVVRMNWSEVPASQF